MQPAAATSASIGPSAPTKRNDGSVSSFGRFAGSALTIVTLVLLLAACQSANQRTAADLMDQRAVAESAVTSGTDAGTENSSMSGEDAPTELAFEEPTEQPAATSTAIDFTPSEQVADPRYSPLNVHSAPATAFSIIHTFPAAGKVTLTGRVETTDSGLWVEVDLFPLDYNGWVPQVAVIDPNDPILGLWTEEELAAITLGNVGTGEELEAPIPFPVDATDG